MKTPLIILLTLVLNAAAQEPPGEFRSLYGPHHELSPHFKSHQRPGPRKNVDSVRRWNEIAIKASALDHTPVAVGENRFFGEQVGPCRTSYALAIVHIAMFDALNAVAQKYESYTGVQAQRGFISLEAAVSQSAHDALVVLYPSQAATFGALLFEDLTKVKNKEARANGIALGRNAAAAILLLRTNDGSDQAESFLNIDWTTSDLEGHWRQDPIGLSPIALGARWAEVAPFSILSSDQFRIAPPPLMTSSEYTIAFNEAKNFGGDGITTPTIRDANQTRAGLFWCYDGTPGLGTPPRLYNQIAVQIADQMKSGDLELARLLALVNVAMADAGMAIWESKYHYDFWRPVTAIRESDPGTGPLGAGDGNPNTQGDPTFSPLGAPASNLTGPNFTPPFPAYPSGHAGFGAAMFQILRRFYGTDRIAFTVVSDELNGVTQGNNGMVRPLAPRTFASLSQAEEENGQSRIYLGIHWSFDKTGGIAQGRQVANYVFDHEFRRLKDKRF